jgi:isocitrate lyase
MSRIVPLEIGWNSPRWIGITRAYQAKDLERLRGTARVEHSLARAGSEKLWRLLHREEYVPALSALTGTRH